MPTPCHPERSECFAKRSIHGVEGPRDTHPRHGRLREFPPCSTASCELPYMSISAQARKGSFDFAQDDRYLFVSQLQSEFLFGHFPEWQRRELLTEKYRDIGVGSGRKDVLEQSGSLSGEPNVNSCKIIV